MSLMFLMVSVSLMFTNGINVGDSTHVVVNVADVADVGSCLGW